MDRWRRRTVAQASIAALVAVARVVAVAWYGPVVMPDSERYWRAGDQLTTFEVWHGFGPGVVLQSLYAAPVDVAVVLQTALAAALWGAAATYGAAGQERAGRSWVCFGLLLAWSLSPWFVVWDDWVMTEAVELGATAVAVVGLAAVRRDRAGAWGMTAVGMAIAVLTRPYVGVLLVPVLLLVAFWPRPAREGRTAPRRAIVLAGVLGAFVVWQLVALEQVAAMPYSYLPQPESMTTIQATDRLAGRGHVPGYLHLARDDGMPPCDEAARIVRSTDVYDNVRRLRAIDDCPGLDRWLEQGGLSWRTELTENFRPTMAEMLAPRYWIDDGFAHYMFGGERTRQFREWSGERWPTVIRTVNVVMLGSVGLALLWALVVARGERWLLALVLLWSVVVFVVSWGEAGMEHWRHQLAVFPLLGLFAFGLVVDVAQPGQRGHARSAD